MFRNSKCKITYEALENRCLLANSVIYLNPATSTLHINAGDTTIFSNSPFNNEMVIALDTQTNEVVITESGEVPKRFDASQIDRISYRGTFEDDLFTNETSIDARVVGLAGDDVITSGGGNDTVIASNGNDTIIPGDGDDYVAGGQGNDQIIEASNSVGIDRFFGGPGIDTLEGGGGDDFLVGDDGDDTIDGGRGNDTILGQDGIDTLFGGSGNDLIYGGSGSDIIDGGFGIDRILGQEGNDVIDGGVGADRIFGHAGNDLLNGGDHNDVLYGGDGDDVIHGESGNDRLFGNSGNDELYGGVGADRIISATTAPSGNASNAFGQDTIETGNDTDVDFVLAFPDHFLNLNPEDQVFDTEVIRRNLQRRYLVDNLSKPGWQQTVTGLQYRIINQGTGDFPLPGDYVTVNEESSFIDGEIIETSDDFKYLSLIHI